MFPESNSPRVSSNIYLKAYQKLKFSFSKLFLLILIKSDLSKINPNDILEKNKIVTNPIISRNTYFIILIRYLVPLNILNTVKPLVRPQNKAKKCI